MITKLECMDYILDHVPEFEGHWTSHLKSYDSANVGLCLDVASFATFVILLLESHKEELNEKIFLTVENLMTTGDREVVAAVSTCFLENLLNRASTGSIDYSSFVGFLGQRSREFCKEWDQFTGVFSDGL